MDRGLTPFILKDMGDHSPVRTAPVWKNDYRQSLAAGIRLFQLRRCGTSPGPEGKKLGQVKTPDHF